jgi:Xaa-Pro aminopeptidase
MFHTNNRKRLFAKAKGELIILTAYDSVQQSGDMAAPFLQESSFWWVTGIKQPGWKVVLDTARGETTLVRPHRSDVDVIFNGESNDDEIRAISGIHHIISQREFEGYLRQLHRHHTIAYTLTQKEDHEFVLNPAKAMLVAVLKRIFDSVQYSDALFAELKAIKQPDELARMRSAMKLTCDTFSAVQSQLASFKTEAEIEAEFIYAFHNAGAHHAYEPIVASGSHACTLHYIENSGKLRAREMVLIDIGARVDGYSADVTRTYCRNPTKRQIEVHAAVVEAEQAIINLIAPGLPITDYLKQVDEIMKHALQKIGLLKDLNDTETYRKYFPHAVSHGLGVDTHDSLGRPRYLEPGMVLTVEPGIYIPEESIGVRIEDDILVTKTGYENMTGQLSTALAL